MHILNQSNIRLTTENRLYGCTVPIIGLTGGIATGKSTVSQYLSQKGCFIIDADILIKEIYQQPTTLDFIQSIAPTCINAGVIDFQKLREVFFTTSHVKLKIEQFLYQKLPERFMAKLNQFDFSQNNFIFYDVPLLFEKKLNTLLDQTVLIYCPRSVQIDRLQKRDKTSLEIIHQILDQQLSIESKKDISDFVIDNSSSIQELYSRIDDLLKKLCL